MIEALLRLADRRGAHIWQPHSQMWHRYLPAETADFPRDDYDRAMAINLRGVWRSMNFELR